MITSLLNNNNNVSYINDACNGSNVNQRSMSAWTNREWKWDGLAACSVLPSAASRYPDNCAMQERLPLKRMKYRSPFSVQSIPRDVTDLIRQRPSTNDGPQIFDVRQLRLFGWEKARWETGV